MIMEDNKKASEARTKMIEGLAKIKVVDSKLPNTTKGKIMAETFHTPNARNITGFVSRAGVQPINLETFKSNPAWAIKQFPWMAKYTNATTAQVEFLESKELSNREVKALV